MRVLRTTVAAEREAIAQLQNRSFLDRRLERKVKSIIDDVEKRGDEAVSAYAERFDRVRIPPRKFRVEKSVLAAAFRDIDGELLSVLRKVERNLVAYHSRQRPKDWRMDAGRGSSLAERWLPINRVGVYVPAGQAPLVSSVLMGLVPARVAGVREVVVCSPPARDAEINRHILAACAMLGVREVYRIGGVQAIAAMALGTESIRRVDKIVGPGGAYVTMAKKLLYGRVGIDIVAGPSEILILADDSANPRFVAADLLSQAEHGTGYEVCLLVTDSAKLAEDVQKELEALAGCGESVAPAAGELLGVITIVIARDLSEAVKLTNDFAAEHVEVMTKKAASVARQIRNAGAVFVGPYSPVPVGDFYAGPNHVLPTGAAAKFSSGLSVLDFMKRMSVVSYTRRSLSEALPAVASMAEAEGLRRHADALRVRFRRDTK
ncbi:MAG: histidinol dehydrogenase [bacterium]|nr:histidinol dehydrogenase [bacterium]